MKTWISLILFVLAGSLQITAQTLTYDIVLFGNTIGQAKVERSEANGKVFIRMTSNAETKVMFKTHKSSADIQLQFEEGKLTQATVKRERDGEQTNADVTWDGAKYIEIVNGEKSVRNETISFVSTQMFFQEPTTQRRLYVEKLGQWVEIDKKEDGTYVTKVDGAKNTYVYKNGKLYELKMRKGAVVTMRLRS